MKKTWLLVITTALMLAAGCAPAATTPYDTGSWTTPVLSFTIPPSTQELSDGGYAHPEMPRIRAEALHYMMANAAGAGAFSGMNSSINRYGMSLYWDDFVIVDTLATTHFNSAGHLDHRDGHIEGSVNLPFTFYAVTDPSRLSPEQQQAYLEEQQYLEKYLYMLPRDELIVIYDQTSNDEASCLMAQMLLDHGYDPALVVVLWQGLGYWHSIYPLVMISV